MSRLALEASFRATTYRIDANGLRFDLRIDETSPLFCEFLRRHAVEHWALITAYNPGTLYSDAENARFHTVFLARLSDIGCTFFPASNVADGGVWPTEPGVFLLHVDEPKARALALEFSQQAFVYGEADGVARLIWTLDARNVS